MFWRKKNTVFTIHVRGEHIQIYRGRRLFHDFGTCERCRSMNFIYTRHHAERIVRTYLTKLGYDPILEWGDD